MAYLQLSELLEALHRRQDPGKVTSFFELGSNTINRAVNHSNTAFARYITEFCSNSAASGSSSSHDGIGAPSMINGKRIAVVLPAYNAEKTLERRFARSRNSSIASFWWTTTARTRHGAIAASLGLKVFVHDRNYGYGRNQQTCYREALAAGADVVIMVHPDYQYTPLLVTAMASMVAYDVYDVVLGSRIIGGRRCTAECHSTNTSPTVCLTAFENLFLGVKLSEYHTGYRAFSSEVLTNCRCWKIQMISFSTTRCWRSVCTSDFESAKSPVRRNISPKHRPSTSAAA